MQHCRDVKYATIDSRYGIRLRLQTSRKETIAAASKGRRIGCRPSKSRRADPIAAAGMITGGSPIPFAPKGPVGAYPESGYFRMPEWTFVDIIPPQELVEKSRTRHKQGVTIFGGCCGLGPEHIAALSTEYHS